MKKEQIIKLLKVFLVGTAIMLITEIIFSIPQINNFFSDLVINSNGWVVYLVIWLIMFAQVTILNIPAYVILVASINSGIGVLGWQYLLTVISAYMTGCILAYFLGKWFGIKAVKWCAGSKEDFEKWCNIINKKGKWWYFATVILPIFPDDLLCIVAGSVKFNFLFYFFSNLIGRSVGLITMLLTLKLIGNIGGGFPFMIIVWGIALIAEFIALIILNKKGASEK